MEKNSDIYKSYLTVLKAELIPAMGCTEPIAVAYCAAVARDTLGKLPSKVKIGVSGSILKNVKSVIVPNTDHMKGIEAATAVGIVAGKAEKVLEVIADVKEDEIPLIKKFMEEVDIKVSHIDYGEVFDILIELEDEEKHNVKVRIAKDHTNILLIEKDGKVIKGESVEESISKKKNVKNPIDEDKKKLNIKDIVDFANTCDLNDVKDIISKQIECNYSIALEGIKNNYGSNIGKILLENDKDNENVKMKAYAAAGSDARMNGCEMPVIINSGSGNQGITVSVPIIQYAKDNKIDEEKLYRALIVSNLVSIHEKFAIGTLSAFCGAVTAGAASGAGIAYIKGGNEKIISETIKNALGIVSGIVCDGAKASCAGKIAASVEAGLLGYQMSLTNNSFMNGDGIVNEDIEKTIDSVGRIGYNGMRTTNDEIIDIMLNNK